MKFSLCLHIGDILQVVKKPHTYNEPIRRTGTIISRRKQRMKKIARQATVTIYNAHAASSVSCRNKVSKKKISQKCTTNSNEISRASARFRKWRPPLTNPSLPFLLHPHLFLSPNFRSYRSRIQVRSGKHLCILQRQRLSEWCNLR